VTRQELVDNLAESMRRGELVTLTLRSIAGFPVNERGDVVITGRIVTLAEHYTGKHASQIVLARAEENQPPLVIGFSMVRQFAVGRRAAPTNEEVNRRGQ
jgi:hypothetical protein